MNPKDWSEARCYKVGLVILVVWCGLISVVAVILMTYDGQVVSTATTATPPDTQQPGASKDEITAAAHVIDMLHSMAPRPQTVEILWMRAAQSRDGVWIVCGDGYSDNLDGERGEWRFCGTTTKRDDGKWDAFVWTRLKNDRIR